MFKKGHDFSLPCFIISFKLGAWSRERQTDKVKSQKVIAIKKKKFFCLLFIPLNKQTLSNEEIIFLLTCAAKIKDSPIQRTYSWIDLDKKIVLFDSEQHFGWSNCSCWVKIKNNARVQICWIAKSEAFSHLQENSKRSIFNFGYIFDLNELKYYLKSVYEADFTKQASSIQEITEIIHELELN